MTDPDETPDLSYLEKVTDEQLADHIAELRAEQVEDAEAVDAYDAAEGEETISLDELNRRLADIEADRTTTYESDEEFLASLKEETAGGDYEEFKRELLQDPATREAYDRLGPKYELLGGTSRWTRLVGEIRGWFRPPAP